MQLAVCSMHGHMITPADAGFPEIENNSAQFFFNISKRP
jgi:hypothetical protein